jgi:hypothetical protein
MRTTIPASACKRWGKPRKPSVTIAGLWTEIWTPDLLNTNQFDFDARFDDMNTLFTPVVFHKRSVLSPLLHCSIQTRPVEWRVTLTGNDERAAMLHSGRVCVVSGKEISKGRLMCETAVGGGDPPVTRYSLPTPCSNAVLQSESLWITPTWIKIHSQVTVGTLGRTMAQVVSRRPLTS